MEDLATWLRASLNPSSVKQAEKVLKQFTVEPNALQSLLALVLDESQDREVRQAAIVQFKLAVERRWFEVCFFPSLQGQLKYVMQIKLFRLGSRRASNRPCRETSYSLTAAPGHGPPFRAISQQATTEPSDCSHYVDISSRLSRRVARSCLQFSWCPLTHLSNVQHCNSGNSPCYICSLACSHKNR
jgi:hypothetical protein